MTKYTHGHGILRDTIWWAAALSLLSIGYTSAVWAGPVNPLQRPTLSATKYTEPVPGGPQPQGLPPPGQRTQLPPVPGHGGMVAGMVAPAPVEEDPIKKHRADVSRAVTLIYVSAVAGNTAIVRVPRGIASVQPSLGSAAGAPGSGLVVGQQLPQGGAGGGQSSPTPPKAASSFRTIVIHHNKPFTVADVEFMPKVEDGIVTLYDIPPDGKTRPRQVLAMGVGSTEIEPRTLSTGSLEQMDGAVATRVAAKAAGTGSSSTTTATTNSAPSNSPPGMSAVK